MAGAARDLGYAIDDARSRARRAAGKPIGRPHLAAAVLAHPDNAERLARRGTATSRRSSAAYLIPGAPAYARRTRPTVSEAIGWIHDAGGLAFWAHPFWDIATDAEVLDALDRYHDAALDGVECFYVAHDEHQTVLLADRAAHLGLLRSASSDFHGPHHRSVQPLSRVPALRPHTGTRHAERRRVRMRADGTLARRPAALRRRSTPGRSSLVVPAV